MRAWSFLRATRLPRPPKSRSCCPRDCRKRVGSLSRWRIKIASMCAIIGASLTGHKVMTATSGPGFSLKQEAIGYACMAEIPCVIVNVQRGRPFPTHSAVACVPPGRAGAGRGSGLYHPVSPDHRAVIELPQGYQWPPARFGMMLPVRLGDRVCGVLMLENFDAPTPSPEDEALAYSFTQQASPGAG